MKILVTGGAGFIGSHVAEELLEKKYEVIILDNLSTGEMENIKYLQKKFSNKITFIKADISQEKSFNKLTKDISAIVHLAAIVSVPASIENPFETNNITLGGTINVFEFARKNNIQKIVQASSAAVYGDVKKIPVSEKDLGKMLSPYSISKYTSELYAELYDKLFNIKSVSFRFFNVYGERQPANSPYSGVIAKFVLAFKNKSEINIFGDGKNIRDFIYVKDIATAIEKSISKKLSISEVYNLGTGEGKSLLELIKTLEKIFAYKMKINFLPERMGDIKKSLANISKVKKDLKFKAKFDLEKGLRQMLEY